MLKLNAPVKLESKAFFAGMTRVLAKVATGRFDDLLETAFQTIGVDFVGNSPEQLAARLVTGGMTRGVLDLLRPYLTQLPEYDENRESEMVRFLGEIPAAAEEIELTPDLFRHPDKLPLVHQYRSRLAAFLHHRGFADGNPDAIAARLPWYFVQGLLDEYRKKPEDYRPLEEYLRSEVADLWRRERTWEEYKARFNRRLAEPVFDEPYSLPDIFIWPNAYYETRPKRADRHRGSDLKTESEPATRHVVRLKDYLDGWLENATTEGGQAYRVLAGDPGGGKSSFARMFVADRLERGDRVLYVPLHALHLAEQSFQAALNEYCELKGFPTGLLREAEAPDRLLLVLDGLDELANQGEGGKTAARQFAEKVVREVDQRNGNGERRVAVLFCGRPIPVQGIADIFCEPGQILTLLPYAVTEEERGKTQPYRYDDSSKLLRDDLRLAWWKRYAGATLGDASSPPPEYFRDEQFFELTTQPMNNHALAIVRDQVDPEADGFSMNKVFGELLRRVYDRRWSDRPGHTTVEPLKAGGGQEDGFRNFCSFLTVLGQAAWHGGTDRLTTVADFERLCVAAGLGGLLAEYKQRFVGGSLGLFTAFYVRHADRVPGGAATFEFTQKRFGEYLAALRLVDVAEGLAANLGQAKNPRQPHGAKYEPRDLLLDWLVAAGPAATDPDMMPYINDEVRLREEARPGVANRLQELTVTLLNASLAQGMPCEDLGEGQTGRKFLFRDMVVYSRNAEEALLVLHGAAARFTNRVSHVEWPTKASAGEMVNRLRGQRIGADDWAALRSLHRIDFSNQLLASVDLSGARLDGASLVDASLDGARLERANLDGANLSGARLVGARLERANLVEANLVEANLAEANLFGANLDGARLDGANLDRARLVGASLVGARIGSVDLDSQEGRQLLLSLGARL